MTRSTPEPPRIARGLLSAALPADLRQGVLGDLHELFQEQVREHGVNVGRAIFGGCVPVRSSGIERQPRYISFVVIMNRGLVHA